MDVPVYIDPPIPVVASSSGNPPSNRQPLPFLGLLPILSVHVRFREQNQTSEMSESDTLELDLASRGKCQYVPLGVSTFVRS